jgi:hypothetical protein
MDRQTRRDLIRFNAEGVDGLRDRPKSGRPNWLDDGQLAALKALVLCGPDRSAMASALAELPKTASASAAVRERHAPAAPRPLPIAEILRRIDRLWPKPLRA